MSDLHNHATLRVKHFQSKLFKTHHYAQQYNYKSTSSFQRRIKIYVLKLLIYWPEAFADKQKTWSKQDKQKWRGLFNLIRPNTRGITDKTGEPAN